MPKQWKVDLVQNMIQELANMDGLVVLNFSGVTVKEMEEFRRQIEKGGGKVKVMKNRLLQKVLEARNITTMKNYLKGMSFVVYSDNDILSVLKIVTDAIKNNEKLALKTGYLDGQVMDAKSVIEMSKIPSRKELLAMIAGGISGVVGSFAGALNSILTTFVGTIEALEKKQEGK
ncbi:50S ribosomal protein L10 [Thermospira aquatica]|uniref:Large ribosomal subunit protein uL10 n=1 Tax=Thermospira aquatica TaxID=2828656 RepID=A0AAX3BEU6_9SPIR|nr:50S ribosomal protein L10 [Thermospira aquatica]URA10721.1 50S ribosomal protein L10 [Thermospira aquatica]